MVMHQAELQSARAERGSLPRRKLGRLARLTTEEVALLEALGKPREHRSGAQITHAKLGYVMVLSGWAGRTRMFADGRRQILTTLVPGDLLSGPPNPLAGAPVVALTEVTTVDLTKVYQQATEDAGRYGRLRAALELAAKEESDQLIDQVVRLGRYSALERVAHWLLTVQQRLRAVDVGAEDRFPMPLTQELIDRKSVV